MRPGPLSAVLLLLAACVAQADAAVAADNLIGVAAPLSGPSAILGRQIEDGARIAAEQSGSATLIHEDDGCTAAGGTSAARKFADAKVSIVVGFLCTEAIEAALPILKQAGIPVVTTGVRTDSLTDRRQKTGWPVYRLGPRADGERTAVADLLTRLWRDQLFAIIDDGTIYGRELSETFRLAAEQAGLKPVFVDTYRPQLENQIGLAGRLRKAGATHVFVGGDYEDIAILGRDANGLGMGLVIAGGEALRAPPGDIPLQTGTIMIGLPEWSDTANPSTIAALNSKQIEPDGYVLAAYAAMEVAVAAATESAASGKSIQDILSGREFATSIGAIRFDARGDLFGSPYRAFRFDGANFTEVEEE